jgi:hypothetical protein
MKTLLGKISKRITKKLSKYRNWVFENWVSYNLLKKVFFMLVFPLVYLIGTVGLAVEWASGLMYLLYAVLLSLVFASILFDSARVSVAQKRPADFIKEEKVERFFSISFFTLFPLWMLLLFVFANGEKIGVPKEIIPSLQTFVLLLVLAWTGLLIDTELATTISLLESPWLIRLFKRMGLKGKAIPPHRFYPSENIRASARFAVLSQLLANNPDKNVIGEKFPLFYQGIKIYNEHIKDDFGFVLREPKRFYCQARLAAYSNDNVDNIKKGIESLTELVKDDNREPFEIIKSLKEMLNEPASFKDVCADIDADPHRIRKWLSVHSDSIIGITGIMLGVVELFLFFLLFY